MEPGTHREDTGQKGRVLGLFLYFFKVGFYTFGGGWSIIAQLQQEYVQKRHWITDEELLDITSVGRSLPGLMVGNVTYLFGYHAAGFPGALACLLGITLPSLIVLTAVTWCYGMVKDNLYVSRAMTGIRAAVVPIIASAALKLRKAALADSSGIFFLLLAFVLYFFFGISCILIVLISGLLGWLLCLWRTRKGGFHDPS